MWNEKWKENGKDHIIENCIAAAAAFIINNRQKHKHISSNLHHSFFPSFYWKSIEIREMQLNHKMIATCVPTYGMWCLLIDVRVACELHPLWWWWLLSCVPDEHSHDFISQFSFIASNEINYDGFFFLHFPSLPLWWLDRCYNIFFIVSCSLNFIEMEANGKQAGKRSILWASAEIIQSRFRCEVDEPRSHFYTLNGAMMPVVLNMNKISILKPDFGFSPTISLFPLLCSW